MSRSERGEKEVVAALRAAGHRPAVSRFEEGTETAGSSARALGVGLERIVKSLVFLSGGAVFMVLLPGDRRADVRAVARAMGVGKARMADPEDVLERTGYPVGAVPPVGHAESIPILMDEGIPAEGFIYPAAGERNNAFQTTFEDLRSLTGAKVCRVSREE